MPERNIEMIRRVLSSVNSLSPSQREIMCLCAVAYEAGRASANRCADDSEQ